MAPNAVDPTRHSAPQQESDGERRDRAGDERGASGARRDRVGDARDVAGDERDQDGAHRDRLADLRDGEGDERNERARVRDVLAQRRDLAGQHRDRAAEERDRAADGWEADAGLSQGSTLEGRGVLARRGSAADRVDARQDREAGARERALAKEDRDTATSDRRASSEERSDSHADRDLALGDRTSGAAQRSSAELDRTSSDADRASAADERRLSHLDELTGVSSRGAGLFELTHVMARSRREDHALMLAFVDADHLKATNDALGHEAGDRLLVGLAAALSAHQRSYDVIMRYGGDEFVCAISDVSPAMAQERMQHASDAFAATGGTFTYGLAQWTPDDTTQTLINRADAAMYAKRGQRGAGATPDRHP